jgi:hypothetical protein
MSSCCMCRKQVQLEQVLHMSNRYAFAHYAQLLRDKDLLVQLFSCVGQRCSICNSCMCGTEFLLVQLLPVWNSGAVFASVACVGQSFIGAYVSCVEQRCSICISGMCRTEFYWCICFSCVGQRYSICNSCMCVTEFYWCICVMRGTEVQYLHQWIVLDRVLLMHMFFMCGTEVQYLQQLHVSDRVLLVQLFFMCGTDV